MNSAHWNFSELTWTEPAWTQLWQVTLVAAVVLLAVGMFCRRRPYLAYMLLMLVVIKCIVPPLWSSPVGVFSWLQTNDEASSVDVAAMETEPFQYPPTVEVTAMTEPLSKEAPSRAVPTAAPPASPPRLVLSSWRALLLGVWATGTVLCGLVIVVGWCRQYRAIRRRCVVANGDVVEFATRLTSQLRLRRQPRLWISQTSGGRPPFGPLCFGILRPTVVLPDTLVASGSPETLAPILAHELVHLHRGDTLAAAVQVWVTALWWFHPLVWIVSRQLSRQRERCCDQAVVATTGCAPEQYAQGVLNVLRLAHNHQPMFLASGIRPVDVTGQRLEAIMAPGAKMRGRTPWFCWAALVVGAMMLIPGRGLVVQAVADDDASTSKSKAAADAEAGNVPLLADLVFGPVIERTVNDDNPELGDNFIDLDTGKLSSPPKELLKEGPRAFLDWCEARGIDAMGEGDMLLGFDMIAIPTAPGNWEPSPSVFAQLDLGKPGAPVPIVPHGKLPSTYMFKTREGRRGVLQIVTLNTEPYSTTIRYKLVKQGRTDGSSEASSRTTDTPQSDDSARPTTHRVVFVPKTGLKDKTSWTALSPTTPVDGKPYFMLMANVTLGGGFPVKLNDETLPAHGKERFTVKMTDGSNEELTVVVTRPDDTQETVKLVLDEPAAVEVDGETYTLSYGTSDVARDQPAETNKATIIVSWQPGGDEAADQDSEGDATESSKDESQGDVSQGSEMLRRLRRESAPILAAMAEEHGYGLEPGQVLRRVPPPFDPIRMKYYRTASPSQAEAIPAGPSAMLFRWEDGALVNWGMTFGQTSDEGIGLSGVIDAVAGIKGHRVEVAAEVAVDAIPGDWVVRPDAAKEQILAELETILREALSLPVRLVFRDVERTVYVARGDYRLTPLQGRPAEEKLILTDQTILTDPVEIFAKELVPDSGSGGGTGDFAEFLEWLGRWIGTPIKSEVSTLPMREISWALHGHSPATGEQRHEDHDAQLVLANVTKQTKLTFEKETRPVKILFVERAE